jgi:tripartite-type tricarboxylate transporter receptor subunit TctC
MYEGVMAIARRRFLQLAGAAVAAPALSRRASALDYPTRPVRIIVGFAPGGGSDILVRPIAQWLTEHMSQPFIVENRPGANTNLATEIVVNSPADGYTLLVPAMGAAVNASLYDKLNFNFLRDTTPVAGILRVPNVLEVYPGLPIHSVPEFIAYAKANPGKLTFGSSGNGSSVHMGAELFKMMTGVDMVHVPYRGDAPAATDLIGGQIDSMFGNLPTSIEHIRAGKLRALAVTSLEPSSALPGIPPIAQFVPGYEAVGWWGIVAPKNTPAEIIDKLNAAFNAAYSDPKIRKPLDETGGTVLAGPPAAFGKLVADDTEKWAKVVKFSGLKP